LRLPRLNFISKLFIWLVLSESEDSGFYFADVLVAASTAGENLFMDSQDNEKAQRLSSKGSGSATYVEPARLPYVMNLCLPLKSRQAVFVIISIFSQSECVSRHIHHQT
jgi:hypothetical protein